MALLVVPAPAGLPICGHFLTPKIDLCKPVVTTRNFTTAGTYEEWPPANSKTVVNRTHSRANTSVHGPNADNDAVADENTVGGESLRCCQSLLGLLVLVTEAMAAELGALCVSADPRTPVSRRRMFGIDECRGD